MSRETDRPHWLLLGALVDALILVGVVGTAVIVKAAVAGQLPPSDPIPWGVIIQGGGTVATAVLAWLLRGQVQQLHMTFNSKMDEYIKLTKAASEAEGVLKGRAQSEASAASEAKGVIEGRKEKP